MDSTALLARIKEFQIQTGISDTAIGLAAVNDGKFVSELRAGRRCWSETADKVLAYIALVENERAAA